MGHAVKMPYVVLTAVYCAGIFWLSAQPVEIRPEWTFPGQDKLAHMLLYGGLAAVVSVGLRRRGRAVTPKVQFYAPIAFAALYGISDEIHQSFVPARHCDMLDLFADGLGATMIQGLLCFHGWHLPVRAVLPVR